MAYGSIPIDASRAPLGSSVVPGNQVPVTTRGSLLTNTDANSNLLTGVVTSDIIREFALNGQAYSAIALQQIGAAAQGWYGISVFNPSTSGKNVMIYSLKGFATLSSGVFYAFQTTSDPALHATITPVNQKFGSAASVLTTSVTWNDNAAISFPGATAIDSAGAQTSQLVEMVTNGGVLLLPSGSSFGVEFIVFVVNNASYGLTVHWLEY